jgi:tRNA A37 methylthiotransferase MiaB
VGFCGETEAHFEATLALLRAVRFDQVFAAAYSARPGTPAMQLADDVPAAEKRRRLNVLLGLQEAIGRERNEAWLGRRTEVLVEEAREARSDGHGVHETVEAVDAGGAVRDAAEEAAPLTPGDGSDVRRLVGRNREHKLVHFDGPADRVGHLVTVVVERAGPYALAGRVDGERHDA